MRHWVIICALVVLLTPCARALELPADLQEAIPRTAEDLMGDGIDFADPKNFSEGVGTILERLVRQGERIVRERVRGVVSVLLVIVLCGAVEGLGQGVGGKRFPILPMVGALCVTVATAGSVDTLIGLGVQTIDELSVFSHALIPTLAAAAALSSGAMTASVQQVTTVFFVDLLLRVIHEILIPLVYLYIGALTASAMLAENRLGAVAEAMKKGTTWVLTTMLLAFTFYLSMARVLSGTVDGTAVKVAKAAVSGAIPVVGGIISEAMETVLLGAGLMKNTVGIFGALVILAACAYPFLQLGVQYLLYKATGFLAAMVGLPQICKLVDGLAGAFGLVLGMTGACALLVLISVFSAVAAVLP